MSIFEMKITPSVDSDTGEITMLVESLGERISKEVMYTKDKATRAALIALGWTPPELKKYTFTAFFEEDGSEFDTYELLAETDSIAYRIIQHIQEFNHGVYYRLFSVEEI